MATYTTNEDIVNEFKSLALNPNAISESKIELWRAQAFESINSRLRRSFQLPITKLAYPEAFLILQNIETFLVAHRVQERVAVQTGGSDKLKQQATAGDLLKQANGMLQDILDGKIELLNVTVLNQTRFQSLAIEDDDVQHTFVKGRDQW